jgi:hypothetical protein
MALVRAQAQDLRPVHSSGVINDYSPSTVPGAPYENRGDWSLEVQRGAPASPSADLTMETSDYGISGTTEVDPTNPASIAALERLPSASLAAITTDGANRDTGMLTVLRQPKQREFLGNGWRLSSPF